ncbi:MAG: hypothetical protein EA353_07910 [Puniceicoccaceae bacterium]|nr:MAG: hypothetical protein EA353_07910 [Puniceicoccaceae bacterium]
MWPDDRRLPKWPTLLALIGTVLIHLSVILVLPAQLMPIPDPAKERARPTEYEISLVDPEQLRYVEANPAVPQNEPDRTDQYSYRSQQAADESPLSDPLNQPRVEGETDSQKIIQGTLEQSPPVEPGIYAPEAQPGEGERDAGGESGDPSEPAPDSEPSAPSLAQPLPAPDFLQQEVVSEAGPGSQIEPVGEASEVTEAPDPNAPIDLYRPPADQPVEASMADGGRGASQRQAEPRPRPRLAPELVTGPLMRSQGSASRRGTLAIDATFSEFGEYEQQFYAAVQTGWYQEIEFFQPIDTASQVHVRFTLHADGRVSDVHTVHSTASEIATFISENAISKRSPFRPWTREMVQVFGQERTLNVRFHYR